jgi:aspartate racemase
MKTLGIIGGMSWESTAEYYRLINEGVRTRLGGLHSAELLIKSVDFHPVEQLQVRGDWQTMGRDLAAMAAVLEGAGAEGIILATNTMHKVAPAIEEMIGVPFLHIADAAAGAIRRAGIERVGLLGTAFTMEEEFYRRRMTERFGIEVMIPPSEDRRLIHRVIYDELCLGECRSGFKRRVCPDLRRPGERRSPGDRSGMHGNSPFDSTGAPEPSGFRYHCHPLRRRGGFYDSYLIVSIWDSSIILKAGRKSQERSCIPLVCSSDPPRIPTARTSSGESTTRSGISRRVCCVLPAARSAPTTASRLSGMCCIAW